MKVGRRGFLAGGAATAMAARAGRAITPDWSSLTQVYQPPDWFRDAKFGIWAH